MYTYMNRCRFAGGSAPPLGKFDEEQGIDDSAFLSPPLMGAAFSLSRNFYCTALQTMR